METRRKMERRQATEFTEDNPMPEKNRAHRACERECLDLKARVKELESLLAESVLMMDEMDYEV
jgi:hypothetical protein